MTTWLRSMNSPLPNRIHWIDYAKGIGIFLVVIGHVCRGLTDSSILNPLPAKLIDQWLYAFHMPLFFFLSGLLILGSASKPLKDFVLDKIQTIAYPYFVWSIIQSVLIATMSRYTNSSTSLTNLWRIIYEPVFIFWFLYILFVIMMLYRVAHKLGASPVHFLGFSIFLYCLHLLGISSISWTVPDLVCSYTIYFALGAIIASSNLLPRLSKVNAPLLVSVAINGFLLIAASVWLKLVENQSLVPLIAIIGISAVIALAILLERFKFGNFVKLWGLLSLQIYVVHTIVASLMRIVLQKLFGTTEPFIYIFLGTIAGIYVPIAIDWLCRQVKFRYLFTLRPRKA